MVAICDARPRPGRESADVTSVSIKSPPMINSMHDFIIFKF
jgi:hypothetical protein